MHEQMKVGEETYRSMTQGGQALEAPKGGGANPISGSTNLASDHALPRPRGARVAPCGRRFAR